MTTKYMVALCSTCLVVGGLMGAILFDMTQATACPSESELIASLPNTRSKKQTNLILQDDGETVTQRVTLAEENEAAKPTDETLSQRVITIAEDSAPELSAAEAVDDDYAPLRWTSISDTSYISIDSPPIDLRDWVDADLLKPVPGRLSVYTWDSPVLFQVLRELRQMREACR